MTAQNKGINVEAQAEVRVVDEDGQYLKGAAITGVWSGADNGEQIVKTNSEGLAVFRSGKVPGGGTFNFTVSYIEYPDYSYDASANVETSDSITHQ
jgi:hypothetical protein